MSRLIRLKEVMHRTGMKRSTIYARVKAGTFPPNFKIGERAAAWNEKDIDAWIDGHISGVLKNVKWQDYIKGVA